MLFKLNLHVIVVWCTFHAHPICVTVVFHTSIVELPWAICASYVRIAFWTRPTINIRLWFAFLQFNRQLRENPNRKIAHFKAIFGKCVILKGITVKETLKTVAFNFSWIFLFHFNRDCIVGSGKHKRIRMPLKLQANDHFNQINENQSQHSMSWPHYYNVIPNKSDSSSCTTE